MVCGGTTTQDTRSCTSPQHFAYLYSRQQHEWLLRRSCTDRSWNRLRLLGGTGHWPCFRLGRLFLWRVLRLCQAVLPYDHPRWSRGLEPAKVELHQTRKT